MRFLEEQNSFWHSFLSFFCVLTLSLFMSVSACVKIRAMTIGIFSPYLRKKTFLYVGDEFKYMLFENLSPSSLPVYDVHIPLSALSAKLWQLYLFVFTFISKFFKPLKHIMHILNQLDGFLTHFYTSFIFNVLVYL